MENMKTLSGLSPALFDGLIDNKETRLCILSNDNGAEMTVLNYGARIVSLVVPDRDNRGVDVVTGHSSLHDYLLSEEPYFGAVCGRYANRIAGGRFELDGILYDKLALNNGPNSLHGGIKGFNAVIWNIVKQSNSTVTLQYVSPDGEEGFPGNLVVTVSYQLTADNAVVINYHAATDKTTALNLTNHAYFNLSGHGDPSVHDHELCINAEYYLPTDSTSIPLGNEAHVKDTPMDFRQSRPVGNHIDDDFEQLRIGRGYDHTYILQHADDSPCAYCSSPKTGITMEMYTTEPGVQLYTGNWMTGNMEGKLGKRYPARSALCLETQHFPNSPNEPSFPSTTLRPDEVFSSQTIFKFK
ncbi:MAG: galactose mutarotase [Tannerellaceae bacterium]|jgi:aldose 1-epimerase|nr:galactose mutarotase [Tannerellaceae bacterium]